MSEPLRSRADVEAWLERSGAEWFVQEPTLRVAFDHPDGGRGWLDIRWNGARGVEVFAPFGVSVAPGREDAVDLALADENARLLDGGVRRAGPGVVYGHIVFPDGDGALDAAVLARALGACGETVSAARARVAAAAAGDR
jgi:hypothetical protein